MLIQSTNNLKSGPLKVLIYGESGVGKTAQAASLLKAGFKPIVVSAEAGLKTLEGYDIAFVDITKSDDGVMLARGGARVQRIRELATYLMTPEARAKYDTIFFDTLTEVASAIVDQQIDEKKAVKGDLRQAWGEYAQLLLRLVYMFRDMPHYNVVFLCQEELDKDELTSRRFYAPHVPGNAAKLPLKASLDIIYRLYMENDKRYFRTALSDTMLAKHRGSALSAVEPADLGAIMRKLQTAAPAVEKKEPVNENPIRIDPSLEKSEPRVVGAQPPGAPSSAGGPGVELDHPGGGPFHVTT